MPGALGAQLAGHRDERAVVAVVPAQMRHRDEHLAGVADREPAGGASPSRRLQTGVTHPRGAATQIGQVVAAGRHRNGRLVDVQHHPVARPTQHTAHRGATGSARSWRHRRARQQGRFFARSQRHVGVTSRHPNFIRTSSLFATPTRAMSDNSSLRPCGNGSLPLACDLASHQDPERRPGTRHKQQQWAVRHHAAPTEDHVVARATENTSPRRSAARSTAAGRPTAPTRSISRPPTPGRH